GRFLMDCDASNCCSTNECGGAFCNTGISSCWFFDRRNLCCFLLRLGFYSSENWLLGGRDFRNRFFGGRNSSRFPLRLRLFRSNSWFLDGRCFSHRFFDRRNLCRFLLHLRFYSSNWFLGGRGFS